MCKLFNFLNEYMIFFKKLSVLWDLFTKVISLKRFKKFKMTSKWQYSRLAKIHVLLIHTETGSVSPPLRKDLTAGCCSWIPQPLFFTMSVTYSYCILRCYHKSLKFCCNCEASKAHFEVLYFSDCMLLTYVLVPLNKQFSAAAEVCLANEVCPFHRDRIAQQPVAPRCAGHN